MTLATLILDSLYAGLALIAVGWLLDGLQLRLRRRPAADLGALDRRYACGGPHLTAARERSAWTR